MKKVVLVNRGRCSNIGDQAINQVFRRFIEERFRVEVFESDYTYNSREARALRTEEKQYVGLLRKYLKKVLPLNFLWMVRNYGRLKSVFLKERPHLIVIGGGQLLLPGRFSVAAFLWVWLAKKYKVGVVFSNVGVGGNFRYLEKRLIRYAIFNSDGVNFRDKKSCDLISKFCPGFKNYIVSKDIVLSDACTISADRDIGCRAKKVLLGITELNVYNEYNDRLSREDYYLKWLIFLDSISQNIWETSLIYTTEEDYVETKLFNDYLDARFKKKLKIEIYDTLEEFRVLLKNSSLVISGRMHALILGLNSGCEVKAFPISPKVCAFESELHDSDVAVTAKLVVSKTENFLSPFLKHEAYMR